MDEVIERVARILGKQDGGVPDNVVQGEGKATGATWLAWEAYRSQAIVIMKALDGPLLEPVRQMLAIDEGVGLFDEVYNGNTHRSAALERVLSKLRKVIG